MSDYADRTDDTKPRKRRRDPERTREAILEVSGRLMAKDGPDGLSVSQVAQLAGVNRGTAYHHFQTREQLVRATTDWVSEKLCQAVFGPLTAQERQDDSRTPQRVLSNLARFCVENPEFGRVWLVRVLSMKDRSKDPFWSQYKAQVDHFVGSKYALDDIDAEVHGVVLLMGAILWPVWKRASHSTAEEQAEIMNRFTREMHRMNLHGLFRNDNYTDLEAKLSQTMDVPSHL